MAADFGSTMGGEGGVRLENELFGRNFAKRGGGVEGGEGDWQGVV